MDTSTNFIPILHDILVIIVAEIDIFLTNLAQNERMKESGEYSDNPEEAAQMEEEIKATRVEGSVDGTTVSFHLVTSGSIYDAVSTEGKPVSFSGGTGGMVTMPDGTQVPSEVKPWLQGQEVPDSEEPPSVWKENYQLMASSLVPGMITDYIQSYGSKFGEAIVPMLQSLLQGGGS